MSVPRSPSALVRSVSALLLALAVALGCLAAAPAAHADPPPLPAPNSHGITVLNYTTTGGNDRMLDVTVQTAALFQPVHVRIYLPSGYDPGAATTYPTLYLLHGARDPQDHALPWVNSGDVASIVDASAFRGIVVMPEGGKTGWYTDWKQTDNDRPNGRHRPQWETFHIGQLIPWIDANFRTKGADRNGRTIAGLSMGGYGALKYAGTHPDLFSAVGAFSAPTDIIEDDQIIKEVQQLVVANSLTLLSGSAITSDQEGNADFLVDRDIQRVFGPYGTWYPWNPYHLTAAYKNNGIKMALYTGNGDDPNTGYDKLEDLAGMQNDKLHAKLLTEGVQHRYCSGDGSHVWSYWQGDLRDFLAYRYGTTPSQCPNGYVLR